MSTSPKCKAALHSPLRGQYLIQNKWANLAFHCIDKLLSIWTYKHPKNFSISPPKKILLSNLAHIGDVVLVTSLLPLIKERLPDVEIGFIIASWNREILENHPLINTFHWLDHWKVSKSHGSHLQKIKKTKEMFRVALKEIKNIGYDLFIETNFHFPNSIFLAYRAKIPVRIAYTSGGFGPLLTHPVDWKENKGSAILYSVDLLSHFMPVSENLKPHLPNSTPLPFSLPYSYLVIHPCSGNSIKEWPLENWKQLCEKLVKMGYFLVFTGKGEREAILIEKIREGLDHSLNLCNKLSWSQCITLLKGAIKLVSVDTGMGHVAASVDLPAVLIYTGIHPLKLWKPLSEEIDLITHPVSCHPCHLSRGCSSMDCIRNVSVIEVFSRIVAKSLGSPHIVS